MFQLIGHYSNGSIEKVENHVFLNRGGFTPNMVIMDLDTGDVSRIIGDGNHLQLWHLGAIGGIKKILAELQAQHAEADAAHDAAQQDYDQTVAQASGRWGY